jgi:hypothetical protein
MNPEPLGGVLVGLLLLLEGHSGNERQLHSRLIGFLPLGNTDRIEDLVAFDLSGDERHLARQILVGEFHSSAIFQVFSSTRRLVFSVAPRNRALMPLDLSLG